MFRSRGRILAGALLCAIVPSARAAILIDTFEQGYFKATITGEGSKTNLATGLDRNRCFAGHRSSTYVVNSNPDDYTTTYEVGLGEARVTTPGPRDVSTELRIGYGTGYFEPMNLDLSVFPGPGRLFEVDLSTDPPDLFAEVWSITLWDGRDRIVTNESFGTRSGGIEFRRDGFVGNPNFDWADVDLLTFRQNWNAQNTAPLSYWMTEIRAVPDPSLAVGYGAALATLARRKLAKA